MIHLPAIHLDDVPSPALQRYLREHREARHLFIGMRGEPPRQAWGFFDPDGDAWLYPPGAEEAQPVSVAEIEELPAESFYELER